MSDSAPGLHKTCKHQSTNFPLNFINELGVLLLQTEVKDNRVVDWGLATFRDQLTKSILAEGWIQKPTRGWW